MAALHFNYSCPIRPGSIILLNTSTPCQNVSSFLCNQSCISTAWDVWKIYSPRRSPDVIECGQKNIITRWWPQQTDRSKMFWAAGEPKLCFTSMSSRKLNFPKGGLSKLSKSVFQLNILYPSSLFQSIYLYFELTAKQNTFSSNSWELLGGFLALWMLQLSPAGSLWQLRSWQQGTVMNNPHPSSSCMEWL